jgi:NTE family protein
MIKELTEMVPLEKRDTDSYREMLDWGCLTRMHVVRLLAPSLDHEDQTKDVDFSAGGIRQRWRAGYEQAQKALERAPWLDNGDPLDGVILHEPPFFGVQTTPVGTASPDAALDPALNLEAAE